MRQRIAWGVASLIGLIILFEILARLILPGHVAAMKKRTFGNDRVVFYSDAPFENKTGFFNFAPNKIVRELAYYPDGNGRMTVEYDCQFASDTLGFLSNAVAYEQSDIVLLGDSFAQGQGGCQWLPNLPANLKSRIYSTAVQGNGFEHWENILKFLTPLRVPKKILVLFLTDDFYRQTGVIEREQMECLAGKMPCTHHYMHLIGADMEARALNRLLDRRRTPWPFQDPRKFMLATVPATAGIVRALSRPQPSATASLRILDDMVKRFDVRLVWLGTREELHGGDPRRAGIESALAARKLTMSRCDLPPEGYLPRDGHPNTLGNGKIIECVVEATKNWN